MRETNALAIFFAILAFAMAIGGYVSDRNERARFEEWKRWCQERGQLIQSGDQAACVITEGAK